MRLPDSPAWITEPQIIGLHETRGDSRSLAATGGVR